MIRLILCACLALAPAVAHADPPRLSADAIEAIHAAAASCELDLDLCRIDRDEAESLCRADVTACETKRRADRALAEAVEAQLRGELDKAQGGPSSRDVLAAAVLSLAVGFAAGAAAVVVLSRGAR